MQTVKQGWSTPVEGTFMYRFVSRLKVLKRPLRRLRASYGNLSKRVEILKHELDVVQISADLDPFNLDLREDLSCIRLAYQKACFDDELAARQRAKVKWLGEGDANTRYFHQVIREKRHANNILSVLDASGAYTSLDGVAVAFIDHLKSFMGTRDVSLDCSMLPEFFQKRLSLADSLSMISPITDVEIKDALFHIGNNKAPGPDGFSSKFFKASWDVIGKDLLIAVHNFFYRGHLLKELNHTLICLLPKVPNASSVSDFRPIACCNVVYKCISKVIVGRIKPYLDKLISKAQSAFIPGRRIVDNILMAHELVVGYQTQSGPPRCALKIDLRKAFDMVDWRYLTNMLTGLGFHPVLIKWISELLTTPTYSVLVNGESKGFFKGERGIRQGDPISPYLFTIVMEGFTMIFNQCIAEVTSFGYHKGCEDLHLTHLCFADDLFVFTRADIGSIEVVKKALSLFALRSGLSPNLSKSDIFFGNVPQATKEAILTCLPFRMGTFPIRYLGVPLSPVSLKVADYGVLVTKVRNRILNWKSKFLSLGGRKQLIVSVLQSLQLYWMAIFAFPSTIIHDLEALFRDFLWSHGNSSKGRCRVAWSLVCRPKHSGGLGFKRLSVWNRSLLTKHIWDLALPKSSLWVRWVRMHYLRGENLWVARVTQRWSWVLRKIMLIRPQIRPFIKSTVGNDLLVNAWEDFWMGCGPLSSFISYRFIHASGLSVTTTVSDLASAFSSSFPDA